jgi:cation:H+ antiporter
MLVAIFWLLVGFVLLIKGGDWFVDGATGIARRFHLPEVLIGATVVSIGTTLPEVMVSAGGALKNSGSIAYGNAIGSIICNTALIAALTIAIKPSVVARKSLVLPVAFFFGASAIYSVAAYVFGGFSRLIGILLLLIFAVYMVSTVMKMKNTAVSVDTVMAEEVRSSAL